MRLRAALVLLLVCIAYLVHDTAAAGPPLGPVKGGPAAIRSAAPNAFTDQLISRCTVHYHDIILDHYNWVREAVWSYIQIL